MRRSSLIAVAALAAIAGTVAFAQNQSQPTKPAKPAAQPSGQPAGQPEMQLPPGMTAEDMKACMEAGTPGPNHERLGECVGTWTGKTKMWMTSQVKEPVESVCTATYAPVMDGRFYKCEVTGDMMGMPFTGFGLYGYDNVAQKFQTTWIDNCGTSMGTGTGTLSSDGSTLTWNLTYTCPIQKKAVTMRQVEKRTGKDTMTLEMYGQDPHSGKEFKAMEIAYTRGTAAAPKAAAGR